ncbi:unnamed protein product [Aphanomyces euteiches]
MANLLLQWLNEELQLSQHVECFEEDFASGYLLGEILYRANQQHNFSDFVQSATGDAKIVNFSLLEPTLRSLGIKFDPVTAAGVMNEQDGAAAKLVYQIKTAIERVQRSGVVSNRPYSIGNKILSIHNVPSRLPKSTYDEAMHRSFEHAIRRHVKPAHALEKEKLDAQAAIDKTRAIQAKKEADVDALEATRQQRLHLAKIQREFAQISNEGETEAWMAAQARRRERETRKARYDKMVARRREAKRANDRDEARTQVEQDIDTFEAHHPIPNDKEKKKPSSASSPKKAKSRPRQLSIGYGIRSLSSIYKKLDVVVADPPSPAKRHPTDPQVQAPHHLHLPAHRAESSDEAQAGLDAMRHKRQQRELRCDAQLKRRAKFLKQCDARLSAANDLVDLDTLETQLVRPTASETTLDVKRRHVLTYMDVVVANRQYREGKYTKRRQRDELEAVTRDASAYGMIHHRYTDAVLAQNERYDRLALAIDAVKAKQHELLVAGILDRLVDLVHVVCRFRTTSTWVLPPTSTPFLPEEIWHEFKASFVHADDLVFHEWLDANGSGGRNRLDASLDGYAFVDHIADTRAMALSKWIHEDDMPTASPTPPPPSPSSLSCEPFKTLPLYTSCKLQGYHVLGEIVKYTRGVTAPFPPPPSRPSLPTFPLQVALLGKPFTGRKTLSKMLSAKYNVVALSVHALLDAAISNRTAVGVAALDILKNGGSIPNAMYMTLLQEALTELAAREPPVQGWILDDFISDVTEARDLERLLSGSVADDLPPTLDDRASRLAPGLPKAPLPPTYFHGKSGLDMVFKLEIDRTKLYRHCLGKLIDPVTSEQFHIHANPPPEGSVTRYRLQLWSDGIVAPENVSLHAQSHDAAAPALLQWFRQYNTLRDVDSKDPAGAICDHIDHFFADKAAAVVAVERNAQLAAAAAMAAEENLTRHIAEHDVAIAAAQAEDDAAQAALRGGEEAKAKKDELAVLKAAADATKCALDQTIAAAADFMRSQRPVESVAAATSVVPVEPLASYVASLWETIETSYERVVQRCAAHFRHVRGETMTHCVALVQGFCAFVRREDGRQRTVDTFQIEFNGIVDDMRFDPAVVAELHARADALQDVLLALVESKATESSSELGRMIQADGWKELVLQTIAAVAQSWFQAEIDRFHGSVLVLVDAISGFHTGLSAVEDASIAEVAVPPVLVAKAANGDEEKEVKKPPAKKAPAAATTATEHDTGPTPEADARALAAKALLACKKIVQRYIHGIIAPDEAPGNGKDAKGAAKPAGKVDVAPPEKSGESPFLPARPQDDTRLGLGNASQALLFELSLVQTRLEAIETVTCRTLVSVQQTLTQVEADLRAMLAARLDHERHAVRTLLQVVRSAIEGHVALPHRLLLQRVVLKRLPPQRQEVADTHVRLDARQRMTPRPIIPPYPVVEYIDDLYLSNRQLNELLAALRDVAVETTGHGESIPRPVFIDYLARLASLPMGLPPVWKRATRRHFIEIASYFDKKDIGVVKAVPHVPQTLQAKHKVDEVVRAIGLMS